MKKLLLVISLLLPLLFSGTKVAVVNAENEEVNTGCSDIEKSIVKIVDNYNSFKGNGFVYKSDEGYNYVVTSSKIIEEGNIFSVIYSSGSYKNAVLLGYDGYNEVAVFKTSKVKDSKGVCIGNSYYLQKGQLNYLYGYIDKSTKFEKEAYLNSIGEVHYSDDYIKIYKSIISVDGNNILNGVGVFDELNRLIGMVNGYDSRLQGSSYMVDVNKLIKIADSIVKTGNYKINYIKYSLVDYSSLSSRLRESYDVSDKVDSGVVITTFKPFNFIFGGLNQGMTIIAVNGVEVNSGYQLDAQLSRYEKKSKVCLTVVKKNGKEAFYYVKV